MFYKDKTVCVTGGTGFVGSHIVETLIEHGARIRIPLHNRSSRLTHPSIETIPCDLRDPQQCVNILKGIDYVFHAAGAVSAAGVTIKSPIAPITENLVLTARVIQAAWDAGVKRILLFSSSTAYPPSDHPVREDEMWGGEPHDSYFGYGWMRRYIEKLAQFIVKRKACDVAIVRPSAIYGCWDNFDEQAGHVIPSLIRKAVHRHHPFEVWGSGNEVRDFLHVRDLARGCCLLLEHYATGDPVNISAGESITIKQLVSIICQAAEYQDASIVFRKDKPTTIPKRLMSRDKAGKLFNFYPTISLEKGISETIQWYRDHHSSLSKGVNARR